MYTLTITIPIGRPYLFGTQEELDLEYKEELIRHTEVLSHFSFLKRKQNAVI
jgi:hypothetical protein